MDAGFDLLVMPGGRVDYLRPAPPAPLRDVAPPSRSPPPSLPPSGPGLSAAGSSAAAGVPPPPSLPPLSTSGSSEAGSLAAGRSKRLGAAGKAPMDASTTQRSKAAKTSGLPSAFDFSVPWATVLNVNPESCVQFIISVMRDCHDVYGARLQLQNPAHRQLLEKALLANLLHGRDFDPRKDIAWPELYGAMESLAAQMQKPPRFKLGAQGNGSDFLVPQRSYALNLHTFGIGSDQTTAKVAVWQRDVRPAAADACPFHFCIDGRNKLSWQICTRIAAEVDARIPHAQVWRMRF